VRSSSEPHRRRPWGRSPIISSTAKGSFALLQLRERSVFKSIFFKGAGACMHTETNGSQHRETNLRSKILGSPHRKMADGSCRVERAAGSSRGESRSPRSLAAGSVCEQQSGGAAHVLFGDWGYRHAITDRFSRQGGSGGETTIEVEAAPPQFGLSAGTMVAWCIVPKFASAALSGSWTSSSLSLIVAGLLRLIYL